MFLKNHPQKDLMFLRELGRIEEIDRLQGVYGIGGVVGKVLTKYSPVCTF